MVKSAIGRTTPTPAGPRSSARRQPRKGWSGAADGPASPTVLTSSIRNGARPEETAHDLVAAAHRLGDRQCRRNRARRACGSDGQKGRAQRRRARGSRRRACAADGAGPEGGGSAQDAGRSDRSTAGEGRGRDRRLDRDHQSRDREQAWARRSAARRRDEAPGQAMNLRTAGLLLFCAAVWILLLLFVVPKACATTGPRPSIQILTSTLTALRSEERRVGKECRSRWS